jgi:hypothetical protein
MKPDVGNIPLGIFSQASTKAATSLKTRNENGEDFVTKLIEVIQSSFLGVNKRRVFVTFLDDNFNNSAAQFRHQKPTKRDILLDVNYFYLHVKNLQKRLVGN